MISVLNVILHVNNVLVLRLINVVNVLDCLIWIMLNIRNNVFNVCIRLRVIRMVKLLLNVEDA